MPPTGGIHAKMIHNGSDIIEKAQEFCQDRHLYIAFLKAAFDTVDHASLCKILTILGAPKKLISLFQRLYSDVESCVQVNGKNSTWFSIKQQCETGMRSCTSPV